jgi:hypothetical protein
MAFPRYLVAASWPFAELMARVGFFGAIGWFSLVIKSKKSSPQAFPKAAPVDT